MVDKELNTIQIVRNVKLYMLTDTKLDEPFFSICNELKEIFNNNLKTYKSNYDFWTFKYFGENKELLYIRYDDSDNSVVLDKKNIWDKFKKYNISNITLGHDIPTINFEVMNIDEVLNGIIRLGKDRVNDLIFCVCVFMIIGNYLNIRVGKIVVSDISDSNIIQNSLDEI